MLIWKLMIQNSYLHIYHEDGWSAPTITILYVSPNCCYVSPNACKHQTMESRQISNTHLPRMSHTTFASKYHHGKNVSNKCELLIIRYSCLWLYWHIHVPCQKLEKACPVHHNITMFIHMFLFWSYTSSESNFELPKPKTGSWVEFTIRS
jgi:hypothetical protein